MQREKDRERKTIGGKDRKIQTKEGAKERENVIQKTSQSKKYESQEETITTAACKVTQEVTEKRKATCK